MLHDPQPSAGTPVSLLTVGAIQLRLAAGFRKRNVAALLGILALLLIFAWLDGFPGYLDEAEGGAQSAGTTWIGPGEIGIPSGTTVLLLAFLWFLFAALVWPLWVWRDAGPSRRGYHWVMPVDRRVHDLVRVAAGAVWLETAVAATVLIAVAVALGRGRGAGLAEVTAGGWATLFLSPLALYLLASVAALVSDHAGRWTFGFLFGLTALATAARELRVAVLSPALEALLHGPLGLNSAAGGAFAADLLGPRWGHPGGLAATLLWLVGAAALVLLAPHLRRD